MMVSDSRYRRAVPTGGVWSVKNVEFTGLGCGGLNGLDGPDGPDEPGQTAARGGAPEVLTLVPPIILM